MIRVLNIINRTYCKWNKKRITNTHLERDHQEILSKYNALEDIKTIMEVKINKDQREIGYPSIINGYKKIYKKLKMYA